LPRFSHLGSTSMWANVRKLMVVAQPASAHMGLLPHGRRSNHHIVVLIPGKYQGGRVVLG